MALSMRHVLARSTISMPSASLRQSARVRYMTPAAAPRLRSRNAAVSVLAYRDAHREKVICDTGRELLKHWFRGVQEGGEVARNCLQAMCDPAVAYRRDQVMKHEDARGVDGLVEHLQSEHQRLELLGAPRIIAAAACGEDDTFFALVEVRYRSRVLGREERAFRVYEADVMYDDTVRKVTAIHERGSLAADDVSAIASLDTAHNSITPFPEDRVEEAKDLDEEKVAAAQRIWCKSRSTGKSESQLDDVLDPSFRLWDAYGVLPVLCDPARRAQADACVVPYDSVKDIIASTKKRYDIDCHLLDSAVSASTNVGFTHWCSRITNRDTGERFTIDGVEVDIFAPDGRITDIFLFRDPMDVEKQMLMGQ